MPSMHKQTTKELFRNEMDPQMSWQGLITLIKPHSSRGEGGRPTDLLRLIVKVHRVQNGYGYSIPAMKEMLYEHQQSARMATSRYLNLLNFLLFACHYPVDETQELSPLNKFRNTTQTKTIQSQQKACSINSNLRT